MLIQRVSFASVEVNAEMISRVGAGMLILVGIEEEDGPEDVSWCVNKVMTMRIFQDLNGKMNLDIRETGGELLVVSQFTLHASTRKGNRPSFIKAAKPPKALDLYGQVIHSFSATGVRIASGIFGAEMKVSLCNDGPVTILLDSKNRE